MAAAPRAQQIEQDIDPVGVANNVLSKLEALEQNREQVRRGGEAMVVGETQPAKKRYGAFGDNSY